MYGARDTMKPLNQTHSRLLDHLTEGLRDPGAAGEDPSSRKFDNAPGAYMAVHVERIGAARYSVAHYFESNGDLVADPDMEFVKQDGKWYPAACQTQFGYTKALEVDAYHEGITGVYRRAYADLRSFANLLLKNIKAQQDIKLPRKPRGGGNGGGSKPKAEAIPVEGEDVGTVKLNGRDYSVEKREPTEAHRKVSGDRPVYVLRGSRGATYLTMRNHRNPNHMFLVNGRSFGVALDGTWLTDEGGQLRAL